MARPEYRSVLSLIQSIHSLLQSIYCYTKKKKMDMFVCISALWLKKCGTYIHSTCK